MKKSILVLFMCVLLVGCTPKALKESYSKMKIGSEGINGYNIDLRIYGTVNDERINEIVKITNYNNSEYKIVIVDTDENIPEDIEKNDTDETAEETKEDETNEGMNLENIDAPGLGRDRDILNRESETAIYIKNEKTYVIDETGKYNETEESNYNNINIYLNSINEISKLIKESKEKIGDNTYDVYEVMFNKDIVNEILKDIPVKYVTKSDVEGVIYTDKNGYVYRIIYKVDDLTINANFYSINTVREISFPLEIK